MPNQPRFLDHIDRMTGYIPGEQPRQGQVIKLNTNENPYPPSPKVLETIRESVTQDLRKYPDAGASGVRSRLSNILGAPPEHFVVGNGSDELLNVILRCFAGPGDRVVFPTPTYPYYDKLIALQDAVAVPVPLDDEFNIPIDKLVQEDARVTLLANPNSPTGIGLCVDQLGELAQRVSGILVIDEAYVDFSQHQAMDVALKHKHVIVARTLSKSFSLAGVRVGFAFASPDIVAGLWKVKEHYNVSSLSLVAAEAALDDIGSMHDNTKRVVATRERLTQQLQQRDFFVWESQANFVLARLLAGADQPGDARPLYEGLKNKGYLVRYFEGQPRLADCLRISVGTDDQIDGLLKAIDETRSQT